MNIFQFRKKDYVIIKFTNVDIFDQASHRRYFYSFSEKVLINHIK